MPTSALPTVDEWMDDVPAVLDAVGSERAARHHQHRRRDHGDDVRGRPPRARLAPRPRRLLRPVPRPRRTSRSALRPRRSRPSLDAGRGRQRPGIMIDLFAPSLAGDERLRRAWSRYERQAASPGSTVAIVRLIYESDVRHLLPPIRVPTLVIHRADAHGFPRRARPLSRRAHPRRAATSSCPAIDNLIWAGDQDAIVAEIQDFVTGVRPAPEPAARPRDRPVHRHRRLDAAGGRARRRHAGRRCSHEHHRARRGGPSSGSAAAR